MKSFYLIGNAFSSSRARSIIDLFSSQAEFSYFYLDSKHFLRRDTNRLELAYRLALYLFGKLIGLISSRAIFILPGGIPSVFEIVIIILFRKQIFFDFYISVYESLVSDRKTLRSNSFRAKLIRVKERWLLAKAKKIFVNSESEFHYFCKALQYEPPLNRCKVIALSAELKPIKADYYQQSQTETLNVFWWGTFIPLHGFEKILQTAVVAKKREAKMKFYCFGPPHFDPSQLLSLIKSYDIEDILVLECRRSLAAGELDELILESAHVALGSFGDTEKASVVCCNKVVEGIAFGLPVVTGKSLSVSEIYPNSEMVYTVASEPESIIEGIHEAAKTFYGMEPNLRLALLSHSARELSVSKFQRALLSSLRDYDNGQI